MRSVSAKLVAMLVIALAALLTLGIVGIQALHSAKSRAEELDRLDGLTRQEMQADMAHDAVRGDVLRAKRSGAADAQEIRSDFADHSQTMRAVLTSLSADGTPDPVRSATQQVAPDIGTYLTLAQQTLTAALATPPATGPYDQFQRQFSVVEDRLPAVADVLDKLTAEASAAVGGQEHRATITLLLTGLLALLVLIAACYRIARGILVPLREVSSVLDGLADGDLTRSATVGSADELGQMATALNGAIGSVRSTVSDLASTAETWRRRPPT